MAEKLVIIGAGMASARLIDHLLEADPSAFDITLFNAEARGSYNRIMLSPVLAGEKSFQDIVTHDAAFYSRHGIACRFGEKVTRIDRAAKVVMSATGAPVPYDKLVIATGSDPFMIPMPGHDLEGVIAYRDLEDTQTMLTMGPQHRVIVIGGGLLGLEAAAGMAARGVQVTVVHIMGHLMERQLDPVAGGLLKQSLETKGITVLCNAHSDCILGQDGRVTGLRLKDGTELVCDLLCMAVGIRPSVALAKDADLALGRAITVSDQLQTSDPDIYAVGECVEHNGALFGLVAPLYDQAKVLANTLLGVPDAFVQKSLATKLKVTGCDLFSAGDFEDSAARDSIVLNDYASGVYKRLVLEDGRLVGAVLYGDTSDGPWYYGLIKEGARVDQMRETLIFGPAYQEEDPPDPSLAVAAWWPKAPQDSSNGDTSVLKAAA